MRDLFTIYHPDFLRNLLIIYAVILVLAMIRYGLEKTIFIEHLFYTLGMLILTGGIGIQFISMGYAKYNNQFLAIRNGGLSWGVALILYSVMIILVFLLRCLLVRTDYVQINKKTKEIEIMSSFLWATVNTAMLWGAIMFFIIGMGAYIIPIGEIKNMTLKRIIGIPFFILVFVIPFYLIGNYTKWIQKLINVGPIKRRIVKVQNGDKTNSILEK